MIRFLQGAAAAFILFFASFSPSKAMPVEVPQDIVFVFDASGSLGTPGYQNVLDFMTAIVQSVTGDPAHALHPTRFGAIRFSTAIDTIYNLTDDQTPSIINAALQGADYPGGQTYTRDALFAALDMFDNQSDSINPKTLVLITDGAPFPTASQSVCMDSRMKRNLDAADVQVNIVGVGSGYNPAPVACLVDDEATQIVEITDFSNDIDFQQGYIQGVVAMPAPGMVAIFAFGIAGIAASRRRG